LELAGQSLSERGYTVTAPVLAPGECSVLVSLYNDASRFRSHIVMERYRFGIGDYKYFANPLPEIVAQLRSSAYPHLAEVADHWSEALGEKTPPFPREHAAFLDTCHKAGQTKGFTTKPVATTVCIRISTATSAFRCKWSSCLASTASTGTAENLSW
jgi:hypothetical protein